MSGSRLTPGLQCVLAHSTCRQPRAESCERRRSRRRALLALQPSGRARRARGRGWSASTRAVSPRQCDGPAQTAHRQGARPTARKEAANQTLVLVAGGAPNPRKGKRNAARPRRGEPEWDRAQGGSGRRARSSRARRGATCCCWGVSAGYCAGGQHCQRTTCWRGVRAREALPRAARGCAKSMTGCWAGGAWAHHGPQTY
jgi:hypothetical protein